MREGIAISPVNMESRREIGIRPGDSVRVWVKVEEKGKIRLQPFEGVVIALKHGSEAGAMFTVRRQTGGVAVEKIFPLYAPVIDRIEILKRAKTRRAKLYHIRDKAAREIRRQMRRIKFVELSTTSDTEDKAKAEEAAKLAEEAKQAEETAKEQGAMPQENETSQDATSDEPQEEEGASTKIEEEKKEVK